MIKSAIQLKSAENRLNEVQKLMAENSQHYTGLELELFNNGLAAEEMELYDQIIEYKKLRSISFPDAISMLFNKPILIDNIGELLSKLRIAAKLSQSEMSKRLDWEQSNLSRFESENYNAQTINKIVEYASALGVWLHVTPSLTEDQNVLNKYAVQPQQYKHLSADLTTTSMTGDTTGTVDDGTFTKATTAIRTDAPEVISI